MHCLDVSVNYSLSCLQGERIVFDSFSSEEFVSKLIGYLSLEEKKGVDRFSKSRMEVFLVSGRGLYLGGCGR